MTVKHVELKQQIIAVCRRLEAIGFTIGTYGNVSARVPEGLIVTPSRVDYAILVPEDMVTVDLDGHVVNGTRLPSSETDVHRLIYVARADVGAVIHSHSLCATALSCMHDTIPVIVEEQSQVVGDEIRCTNYIPAGQHEALGKEVARCLGHSNAVLLANHGTASCGRDLAEAMFTCQIVERVAQMRLLISASGGAVSIPTEYVISERERWLYKYGTAADRQH
ncbi:MAG TPA: class II aldolase/adducin family protein [Aggregatilineaceae bacterium]|nr:class II aldolase/adducin family protein [Aggregatilineaceae bacterium]